ncbi:MAG TPA: hypothetical protein VKJ01_08530 [Candidatus Solibacter sp.]|nr:hypothetical protein [Candidatus Solibacter sp.]
MQTDKVLSAGEWESLIFQAPDGARALVLRLAFHHGAIERPAPEACPVCGGSERQGRLKLTGLEPPDVPRGTT